MGGNPLGMVARMDILDTALASAAAALDQDALEQLLRQLAPWYADDQPEWARRCNAARAAQGPTHASSTASSSPT